MNLNVFGSTHLIYLAITLPLSAIGLYCAKKYANYKKKHAFFVISGIDFLREKRYNTMDKL